jgi:indolepyruvate ferredoxin oxidoreductase alpha subunit
VAGEYTRAELLKGVRAFLERYGAAQPAARRRVRPPRARSIPLKPLADSVHARPPGFCTGCPERPIFTAMKLVERELGPHHVSADIGCHLFSILPPFNLGNTTMGYGLGGAGRAALERAGGRKRAISVMGDGGFWHNG